MRLPLFEFSPLRTLLQEFRRSMQGLLLDLCDELEAEALPPGGRDRLSIGYFRLIARTLAIEDYDHWKVVGWIESLNDLSYFLDIARQWTRERERREFATQLLADCEERFFENSYLDDLFPKRQPEAHRLHERLVRLCKRLAGEITQESLFLVPGLPCQWLSEKGRSSWSVDGTLAANLERAECSGTIAVGLDGAFLQAPRSLLHAEEPVRFVMSRSEVGVRTARGASRILSVHYDTEWHWRYHAPIYVLRPKPSWPRGLTLGPMLIYDRHRVPKSVRRSPLEVASRVGSAVDAIQQAWPDGAALLALLTSRIVPLNARGVVSFSYRHRPGLSFINVFDRSQLDLIDDLIHENSHHHLNLLLRKYLLYKGDHNQEMFYSPWRRSLRPLRGILHATFTFMMGALLFERLATWGGRHSKQWGAADLTPRDFQRACFRSQEEIASVRYSLQDLRYANEHLGWVPKAGRELIRVLETEISRVSSHARVFRKRIAGTSFVRELAQHERQLQIARQTYGPARLGRT